MDIVKKCRNILIGKEKYLNDDEVRIYRNMVGLRNILSHEYLKTDKKQYMVF